LVSLGMMAIPEDATLNFVRMFFAQTLNQTYFGVAGIVGVDKASNESEDKGWRCSGNDGRFHNGAVGRKRSRRKQGGAEYDRHIPRQTWELSPHTGVKIHPIRFGENRRVAENRCPAGSLPG